ncbi:PspC domain-containing protein [Protaetiibacter mangrovi]|uniref:PspC domain-containing protein n=1 Tax=Protaetiibacter mangrovi TaxID=2970926 RepID=A0ABT1ZG40_9MICO|nr:PspC domain-containing protein [Protaetiibacter mangrovi]MCS0499665.1 PspC domain-containing protein [Protaetiibacter mangrovi]
MARRTPAPPPADEAAPDTAPDDSASETAPEGTTPDPAAPEEPEAPFFTWIRELQLPRREGWLGGVCGGVAARLGIDPLIVRGVAVVLAVVGAPVALVYAVAWFLLPDLAGTIHARELGQGRVTRAMPGILAVFLLSFLPLTQSFWFTGALYWGDLGWGGALGRAIWSGVVVVLAVVVVVWLARRASTDIPTTPATTDDRPDTVPAFPDAATASAAAAVAATSIAEPGEPPAPPADASAEELAAWKASQDEWQRQRAAWVAEQRRSEHERRQAEAQAQAVAAAAAARERARIRGITRPRASAGVVFLVVGVALVAGAISAFGAAQSASTRGAEWAIGAAAIVLVLGIGTVAVAVGRRRSGALTFFSILALLALLTAVLVPTDRRLLPPGANYGIASDRDGRYAQLVGTTSLYVTDRDGGPAPVVDLWQAAGSVSLYLDEGATVRIEYTTGSSSSWASVEDVLGSVGGRSSNYHVTGGRLTLTAGGGDPDLVLRLWGGSTTLYLQAADTDDTPIPLDPAPDEVHAWNGDGDVLDTPPAPTPTPTSTPTPEGAAP